MSRLAFPSIRLPVRLYSFGREEGGQVAMVFGTMALVLTTMIGAGVDLSRWLDARDQTISAIDSAVLAAGRALQTGATTTQALELAAQYYAENAKSRIPVADDTVSFQVSTDRTTVKAVGSAQIRTPFIGLADLWSTRLDYLPLFNQSEAPEATTKVEADINVNREIALMLDVSGSMCSPCTKRDDMKAAAADLVNIVIKDNPGEYWTKVAVVPFSADVRPPTAIFSSVTNPASVASRQFTSGGRRPRTIVYPKTVCVGERSGAEKYSDAPATADPNFLANTYTSDGGCYIPSSAAVKPLSNIKADVLAAINGLTTNGGTAGHVGTAWAYYMLSPRWGAVLPEISKPKSYGTTKLKKTAILMTDGEYNFTYDSNGVAASDTYGGSSVNGQSSAAQAVEICTRMKQDGIEVFTIGFELGSNQTAIDTLNACATDPTKAYLATNGEALKQVFRDIAVKLTELHLLR